LRSVAAAGAVGLALGTAAQSTVAQADAPGKQGSGAGRAGRDHGHRGKLHLLDRPSHRFQKSLEAASRKVREERQADRSPGASGATAAGYPSPESVGVSSATLDGIGSCESGGDPAAVSADGAYRGKYQFDYGTWASVGGSGDPAAAPEAEQDYRAALLYARGGSSPWPICG
jgi:hypothetical protein